MVSQAPVCEQKVCVECGMCCDGTLFLHAVLKPGERSTLPEKIEERSYTEEGKDYFRLPCLYFDGRCTIYDRQRADVCGSYRCQLLKDMTDNKVSQKEALDIVAEATSSRTRLLKEYSRITKEDGDITFKQLHSRLEKLIRDTEAGSEAEKRGELLQARCNILEALLIKYFRSAADFDKMMAGRGKDESLQAKG